MSFQSSKDSTMENKANIKVTWALKFVHMYTHTHTHTHKVWRKLFQICLQTKHVDKTVQCVKWLSTVISIY